MGNELDRSAERKRGQRYSEEEVERGLARLSLCMGNTERASRELSAEGHTIPRSTLEKWKNRQYPERYAEIRAKQVPLVHALIAQECEDLVREAAKHEAAALSRFGDTLDDLRPDQAASALRNITTSKAINADKAALFRDRPTEITEHRNPDEILRRLREVAPQLFVEGAAEERDSG